MSDKKNSAGSAPRKTWSPPQIRTVIPVRRTRGGPITSAPEQPFYSVS